MARQTNIGLESVIMIDRYSRMQAQIDIRRENAQRSDTNMEIYSWIERMSRFLFRENEMVLYGQDKCK